GTPASRGIENRALDLLVPAFDRSVHQHAQIGIDHFESSVDFLVDGNEIGARNGQVDLIRLPCCLAPRAAGESEQTGNYFASPHLTPPCATAAVARCCAIRNNTTSGATMIALPAINVP